MRSGRCAAHRLLRQGAIALNSTENPVTDLNALLEGATELPTPAAAAAFPRCADVAAIRATRRESHLDPTEKRISAILLGRVEWELPPFPVASPLR